MEIKEKPITEIKVYENNPRHNDNAVEVVANSIKEFGFKVPIVIDKDGVIIAGHTRYKASKLLNLETVPCIIAEDLTPQQIKAFRIADNKTAEIAEWDNEKLEEELEELKKLGIDMEQFGFENLLEETENEIIEDEVPEVDEENEPTTKLGEVWKLGNHYLMCGDSTKSEDIKKLLSAEHLQPVTVSLLLTDPPYNVAYKGGTDEALTIQNDDMSSSDFVIFLTKAFRNVDEYIKDGGAFYVWHSSKTQYEFQTAMPWEIRQQLIWVKNSLVLGRQDYQWQHEPCFYGWKEGAAHYFKDIRTETTVIEDKPNLKKMNKAELLNYIKERFEKETETTTVIKVDKPLRNGEHPTMKPVKLISYLLTNSTIKGETVLDIFGGSGTTLIAAEQTGRTCYTMELDPRYCDVIIQRWENLTGEKAVML